MGKLFGIYEKFMPASMPLHEKFAVAKRVGYDFVELSVDPSEEKLARLDSTQDQANRIRWDASEAGLVLHSLCVSAHRKYSLGSEDAETVKKGIEISKRAFDFANKLGIRLLLVAGFDVYYEPSTEKTRNRFIENLARITEIAKRQGLIIGLENVEAEVTSTVEGCVKIIDSIGLSNLKLYLDFANMNAVGVDYETEIPKAKGYITAVHIKDTKLGDIRNVPMSTGTVDFDLAARLLRAMDEDFVYNIELLHDAGDRFEQDMAYSLEYAKQRF